MLKILIGVIDIAGHIQDYKNGYILNGCSVTTIVSHKDKVRFPNNNYDYIIDDYMLQKSDKFFLKYLILLINYILRKFVKYYFLLKLSMESDVFHILWPGKFVKWKLFLPLIKLLKPEIKIIFNSVGSDVTWRKAKVQEFDFLGFNTTRNFQHSERDINFSKLKSVLSTLRTFEKYSDLFVASRLTTQMALRPYFKNWLPFHENFTTQKNSTEIISVLHVTKDRNAKGTDEVLKVIERLKQEGLNFNFILLDNVNHNTVVEKLAEARIVVYNPNSTTPGKFGLEALASGCILLTGYKTGYEKKSFPDCPIIDINIGNMHERLKDVLINYKSYEHLIEKGFKWVENFTPGNIVENILNSLEKKEKRESIEEFTPDFFRYHYKPVYGDEELSLLNKYNRYIKKCQWYKNNIEPGVRDGLIF